MEGIVYFVVRVAVVFSSKRNLCRSCWLVGGGKMVTK